MRTTTFAALVSVTLGILGTAAGMSADVAAEDGPPSDTGLSTALTYVTPTTRSLNFTDWKTMKAAHDLDALTSSIPEDFRVAAMIELTRTEAPFATFGLNRLVGHADAWGWDSTDFD